jgi:glycosyltransferase involved in cell wall biosynthesis
VKVALTLDPRVIAGGGSVSFARVLAEGLPRAGVAVGFDAADAVEAILVFSHHGDARTLKRQRRRGVKVLHRLDERRDPGERGWRSRKHRAIARLNGLADVTVFQSEFVRGNMGSLCRAPRAVVIHNGADTTVFTPDGPRRSLAGRPVALHVSHGVGESKRLDRLAALLEALPPGGHLHLAGRHAETGRPWLADPRVTVHGLVGRDEVAALMRSADFLFFPSELEPCPNTPLEALASGLPVLYHPSGGTPEVVGDAGVPLGADLAADIRRVLDPGARWRERALARGRAQSAERAAARYAEIIRATVGASPAGAAMESTR